MNIIDNTINYYVFSYYATIPFLLLILYYFLKYRDMFLKFFQINHINLILKLFFLHSSKSLIIMSK